MRQAFTLLGQDHSLGEGCFKEPFFGEFVADDRQVSVGLPVWIRWGDVYHLKRLKFHALQDALLLSERVNKLLSIFFQIVTSLAVQQFIECGCFRLASGLSQVSYTPPSHCSL